jgi:hypothetical protein
MIAVLLFLSLDASTRLDELRKDFAVHGKAATMAELEQVAAQDSSEGAARASLWLGDLRRESKQLDGARRAYTRVLGRGGELGALAERGLGDVALVREQFVEARRHYEAARPGAPPVLAAELDQKIMLVKRLHVRAMAAFGALGVVVLALAWFVMRIVRRKTPLSFPTEVAYVLPVYALLLAGGWGRDPNVFHALVLCSLASLPLIALSALAAMRSPARTWLHLSVVGAANLALFYVILWRCELIDSLMMTATPM